VALIAAGALVGGCGGDDDDETGTEPSQAQQGPRLADQWAGRVTGTESYISVFTLDDGQTGAYLADGREIAVLALGSLEDGELDLEAEDGTTVTGSADGTATGTVVLNGREYDFTAERATGEAGWYRVREVVDGQQIAAGYIVLADGTQRGAVRRGDEVIGAPELDPGDPTVQVEGVGSLTLLPVAEFVIQEGGIE
jgi:hypothetical protein